MSIDVDRISNFPDEILCHILSFLPTHEAVLTSILARKWRYLWTNVSSFSFYDDYNFRRYNKFNKLVNMALLLNKSQSINSFHITSDGDEFYSRTWISSAISRNVRKLSLSVFESDIRMPYNIFTCKTIECLRLTGPGIHVKLPSFISLPRLTELSLCNILYETDECIQKLLSSCPMLKHVSITRSGGDNMNGCKISSPVLKYFSLELEWYCTPDDEEVEEVKVEIDASSLEELVISANVYEDTTIRLKNLTSLNKADICFVYHGDFPATFRASCNAVLRTIEGLSSVKFLRLRCNTILIIGDATSILAADFQRLIKLDVETRCCEWSALLDLMRCSNSLQVLNLQLKDPWYAYSSLVAQRSPGEAPNCLLLSLKDITFKGFRGLKDELAMMKYVLEHGSVLERLQVHAVVGVKLGSMSKIIEDISAFPRKSRQCKIVFREA